MVAEFPRANPDSESFSIHIDLDGEDFKSYEKTTRTTGDRMLLFVLWFGFLCINLVGCGVVVAATGEQSLGVIALISGSLLISFFLLRQGRSRLQKLEHDHVPYDLIFTREGVVQRVGRTETKYAWREIESIQKRGSFIEIRTWDAQVIVLPERFFPHETDYEKTYNYLIEQHNAVLVGHG